jgi:hypothetical protein
MREHERIRRALDSIAEEKIPDGLDQWPRIRDRLERQGTTRPGRRLRVVGLALAIALALLAIGTVAYAFYSGWLDLGLQGVQRSGLITTFEESQAVQGLGPSTEAPPPMVLVPTGMATTTPVSPTPERPVLAVQSLEGVTVTLNWAYADTSRVAVGYTISGLDLPDVEGGVPVVKSVSLSDDLESRPEAYAYRGATREYWEGDEPGSIEGLYIAYQSLDALDVESLDLDLDIELGGTEAIIIPPGVTPTRGTIPAEWLVPIAPIGTVHFHFTVPLYRPVILEPMEVVEAAGLSMRLEWVTVNPSYTDLRLCYDLPDGNDWQPETTLTIGDAAPVPESASSFQWDSAGHSERCLETSYAVAFGGQPTEVVLTVARLVTSVPGYIAPETCEQVRQRLMDQAGVGFVCDICLGEGRGSDGCQIIQKPEGMSEDEAWCLVEDAFRQIVLGPWVFTVDIP